MTEKQTNDMMKRALSQAEIHMKNIADITMSDPQTVKEKQDAVLAVASEGIKLAACVAALIIAAQIAEGLREGSIVVHNVDSASAN